MGALLDAGLKGRKATCFFAIKDDVINAGARYVDAEVVRDGNLITSRKPDDLPAFMQAIVQAVREAKPAMAGDDGRILHTVADGTQNQRAYAPARLNQRR